MLHARSSATARSLRGRARDARDAVAVALLREQQLAALEHRGQHRQIAQRLDQRGLDLREIGAGRRGGAGTCASRPVAIEHQEACAEEASAASCSRARPPDVEALAGGRQRVEAAGHERDRGRASTVSVISASQVLQLSANASNSASATATQQVEIGARVRVAARERAADPERAHARIGREGSAPRARTDACSPSEAASARAGGAQSSPSRQGSHRNVGPGRAPPTARYALSPRRSERPQPAQSCTVFITSGCQAATSGNSRSRLRSGRAAGGAAAAPALRRARPRRAGARRFGGALAEAAFPAPAQVLRLLDHVLDEAADVLGHGLDHVEHVLEHVADQVRDRHPQPARRVLQRFVEIVRDACVQDPLLPLWRRRRSRSSDSAM